MPNITTLFDAASVPEAKVAILCPSRGTSYTYGEVRGQMNRLAQGLLAAGVRRGDRVCIYLESSPEYLFSYFAIWRIGAVAVPTNRVYRGEELLYAITNAGAVAVITDPDGALVVSSVRDQASCLQQVVCTEEGVPGTTPGSSSSTTRQGCVPWTARSTISASCSTPRGRPVRPRGRC